MPLVFTKPQIRRYLADMGYGNVDDGQLNDFMKDLKKLIKHDERTGKARKQAEREDALENDQGHASTSQSRRRTADTATEHRRLDESGVISSDSGSFHSLNETAPDSVRYSAPRSGLSRQDEGRRLDQEPHHSHRHHGHHHQRRSQSIDIPNPSNAESKLATHRTSEYGSTSLRSLQLQRTASSGSKSGSLPTTSSSVSIDSSSASSEDSERRKPKFSIPDHIKSDPVALYHYYNSYWTRHKPPGSDRRMQLRWNVRAGTMGRVPCNPCGEKVNYLKR